MQLLHERSLLVAVKAFVSGTFRANYCPGVSGCRAAISFDDTSLNGEAIDLRDLSFIVTFNNSAARPIWLVSVATQTVCVAKKI